jgi:hypothetical protein
LAGLTAYQSLKLAGDLSGKTVFVPAGCKLLLFSERESVTLIDIFSEWHRRILLPTREERFQSWKGDYNGIDWENSEGPGIAW